MSIFVDTQKKDYIRQLKVEVINRNLLDCYNRIIEKQDIDAVIKSHKSCINRIGIISKNKYRTLTLLQHYKNTRNKSRAFALLTNSLNNRRIFSMFSSDEERKNKH